MKQNHKMPQYTILYTVNFQPNTHKQECLFCLWLLFPQDRKIHIHIVKFYKNSITLPGSAIALGFSLNHSPFLKKHCNLISSSSSTLNGFILQCIDWKVRKNSTCSTQRRPLWERLDSSHSTLAFRYWALECIAT